MDFSYLPAVNASLNAIAASLLLRGRSLAKQRRIEAHRRTMIAAFIVSTVFLALYLLHKASKGFESCLLYTSDAADDLLCVCVGGRSFIQKKRQ